METGTCGQCQFAVVSEQARRRLVALALALGLDSEGLRTQRNGITERSPARARTIDPPLRSDDGDVVDGRLPAAHQAMSSERHGSRHCGWTP